MSEDIQVSIIIAITIICLAFIGRGCFIDNAREETKRILGTNGATTGRALP